MTAPADGPQPADAGTLGCDLPPSPEVTEDPAESFTPQRATRWLEPRLLLQTSLQVVVSGLAAELTYRFLLAIFPFFIFLASLGGMITALLAIDDPSGQIVDAIGGVESLAASGPCPSPAMPGQAEQVCLNRA